MSASRPLRIFLCCQQAAQRHAVPAYSFWADYFRGGLTEAGHTVIEAPECDWAAGLVPLECEALAAWREQTWSSALDFLRREHARAPIDIFLSYLFPRQIIEASVLEIRALGIPCVNFFCDNVREFRSIPAEFSPFDLHWVPEHKAVPMYRRASMPSLHAPMPCWVPPAYRAAVELETLPITFVGTRDEQRERLLAEAIGLGLEVELRGVGWGSAAVPGETPRRATNPIELARRQVVFARQHGWSALVRKSSASLRRAARPAFNFEPFARMAPGVDHYWSMLRDCIVCIGINRYPSMRFPREQPDTYSRLRDIEAPMAGACYLTEWTDGLDELYEPGVEIETYCDAAELAGKAGALAADPARRRRLRAAGQRRALADHTIATSVARIAARFSL